MEKIIINPDQYLEVEKLALGVFSPLKGFMDEDEFYSCVNRMRLHDGTLFSIPIVFAVDKSHVTKIQIGEKIELCFQGECVAYLLPSSIYRPNKECACEKIFGTTDKNHPGISYYYLMGAYFIGGEVELLKRPQFPFSQYDLTPEETKAYFAKMGWKTIVGFQTRNVPHNAHEYLQKVALEIVDGILIQPLVGKKKNGDFTPEAIIAGYEALIKNYYPHERVKLAILSTVMRYAGPREAIFHALIRKNYGCTHFIIGRDHAGVGNYYDKYAGHRLAEQFADELGISIFRLSGPYLCINCGSIVTSKTCPHELTAPTSCIEISGTMIRRELLEAKKLDKRIIRPEVVAALKGIEILIP